MSKMEFKQGGGAKPKIDRPAKIIPAFTVMRVPGGWAYVRLEVDGKILAFYRHRFHSQTRNRLSPNVSVWK